MKKAKITALVLALILIICGAAVGIYAADYYHMDEAAVAAMANIDTSDNVAEFGPDDTTEFILQGGNHAQFGSYGTQDGDGNAAISPEGQLRVTAEAIMHWIAE